MPEKFLISKALDITPKALGKSTSMVFKGLVVLALIAYIGYSGYITLVKPHFNPLPSTIQQADEIVNTYITESDDAFFFGVKFWGLKVGISKPVKAKKPVITQEKNDR